MGESNRESDREKRSRTKSECVLCAFACACHSVPVLSEWAVKHVSQGYSNLITKPVVIHHVPYKSQLPLEGCNKIGIPQVLYDPEQMLQAQAAGLSIH